MNTTEILELLPYEKPFLFVDGISSISEESITGTYHFKTDEYFYAGHFKDHPITPGVILTECMAQIGVVCLGIFLVKENHKENIQIALSNQTIDFYKPVFPNETVTVISKKEYFRFSKLKCNVKMLNEKNEIVARGSISGMLASTQIEE